MSSRSVREKWTGRSMAASLVFSLSFHLLVLAVLALAVHPFQLPETEQAIDVQLLPPMPRLTEAPPQPVRPTPQDPDVLPLRGLRPQPQPRPEPVTPPRVQPEPQPQTVSQPQAPAQPAPDKPQELARPEMASRQKPIDLDRAPATQNRRLNQARPQMEFQQPDEAPQLRDAQMAAQPKAVDLDKPAVSRNRNLSQARPDQEFRSPDPEAQASETVKTGPAAPVLTNQNTIQAPIEIRPPEKRAAASSTPGSGAPAGGGAPASGGGQAGGGPNGGAPAGGQNGRPRAWDYGGPALRGGLSMRLGCINPETYKLTAAERAACLDRFGAAARGVGELGINIPAAKQAEYDRQTACRRAYKDQGIPGSADSSNGTSIRGLGTNPSLKACGPSDR